jgi:excinuclease ABC subunit C
MTEALQKTISRLPDAPGIYLYYNAAGELIYVGKATSLKSRVSSYFRGQKSPRPIEEFIHEVVKIESKETNSVLEAVILEAVYIKKFLPVYNVMGKDDKSWNYIVISKEAYPFVKTLRQHDFVTGAADSKKYFKIFGPYPGLNTKAAMKLLRRLFRFSTCLPGQKRPCLYYEMGQCLGVCTGEISSRDYKQQVIKPLVLFLSGKTSAVVRIFKKQMADASKAQNYEEAARLRDQLQQLTRIQDMTIINQSFFEDPVNANTEIIRRIEGYDISNLGATEKVGSMVVFEGGAPNKSQYRKFIIKTVPGQSDIDSLKEVLNRRLNHDEWPMPDLFLIDGGRPQVSAAKKVLAERGVPAALIGLAKGPERKRNDVILGSNTRPLLLWLEGHRKLLAQVRDEAHRFAITFHRARRAKRLLK